MAAVPAAAPRRRTWLIHYIFTQVERLSWKNHWQTRSLGRRLTIIWESNKNQYQPATSWWPLLWWSHEQIMVVEPHTYSFISDELFSGPEHTRGINQGAYSDMDPGRASLIVWWILNWDRKLQGRLFFLFTFFIITAFRLSEFLKFSEFVVYGHDTQWRSVFDSNKSEYVYIPYAAGKISNFR
jgi:hypothetical protein